MMDVVLKAAVMALATAGPGLAAFEVLGQTGRASAMGGAYAAHADGVSALWYNAAGLAHGRRAELAFDYAQLYRGLDVGPDINQWSAGYVHSMAGGRVGLGVAGVGGDFYSETGAVLGYGRSVGSRMVLGLGLRYLRWSADGYRDPSGAADPDRSGTGLAVDLGIGYRAMKWGAGEVVVAVSGRDLNEPDVSESGGPGIPRRLVLGLGYAEPLLAVEVDVERVDGSERVRAGGEYRLAGPAEVRLRLGASGLAGQGQAGGVDGGLGLRVGGIVLDYAYDYSWEVAARGHQRVTLGYRF